MYKPDRKEDYEIYRIRETDYERLVVYVETIELKYGYWKDIVKYAKAAYDVVRTEKRHYRILVK